MEGDVAAVVDERFAERAPAHHRAQDGVGHGARDGGHRRDEACGERRAGGVHRFRDQTRWPPGRQTGAQQGQFSAQAVQHAGEKPGGLKVSRPHFPCIPPGSAQTVDRAVLQMQAPVRQQGGDRTHSTGNRVPAGSVTARGRCSCRMSPMWRIRAVWPPSRV